MQEIKKYKVNSDHVDCFLATFLKDNEYQKVWALTKCVLLLSNGQAGIEWRVSIYSEIMEYNFKEISVVYLRVIILSLKIDQLLRNVAKNVSPEYCS